MVSLGWGVIRDSLGETMKKIILLGVIYAGSACVLEICEVFQQLKPNLTTNEEKEIFDILTILKFVMAALEVIFIMWILETLNATMIYLENMSQQVKLKIYLRLRLILILAILFATCVAVLTVVDHYAEKRVVEEENDWFLEAAWEINYLLVLIAISCLWKPNPQAKDYAYTIELSTVANDIELETNADTIQYDEDDSNWDQNKISKAVPT